MTATTPQTPPEPSPLGIEILDRDSNRPLPLWEDDQVQKSCPVNVPVEAWQTFLRRARETWEALEDDYSETEERQAEMSRWLEQNQPEPITLSERIQTREQQIYDQMRLYMDENADYSEKTGERTLPREALPEFRTYETHLTWLQRRREELWKPSEPELQELDRSLWVAENLWQDRASPEPEIEDRLWDEVMVLETVMMARHPL